MTDLTRTSYLTIALIFSFGIFNFAIAQDVNKAKANPKRGFYSGSINVSLASSTSGTTIRYTTDGSTPTRTSGQVYSSPIPISKTTVVRAVAYVGNVESEVSASTYLFTSDIQSQSYSINSYPNWDINFNGTNTLDYEMDPNIVFNTNYNIDQSLKSIPSVSLSFPKDKVFGDANGIYRKGGQGNNSDFEEMVSVEFIQSDPAFESYQTNAGLTPHSHVNLKRSLRLYFRSDYGDSKLNYDLFENAPVGSETAEKTFDKLVLRAGLNRSVVGYMPEKQDRTVYVRDEWGRQSQIAMSGIGSHGQFVHLYLNGIYWGLYNIVERPDEDFTSEYLGGESEDWYAGNHGGSLGGDSGRWGYLRNTLGTRDLSSSSAYDEFKQYLDIEHFLDYVILYFYAGGGDWQEQNPDGTGGYENNFYYGNRSSPAGPAMHFVWDFESSWFDSRDMQWDTRSNDGAWVKPQFLTSSEDSNGKYNSGVHRSIARIFRAGWTNRDFRQTFKDRVYKHVLQPGGALTEAESKARFMALSNFIEEAVVAEFARWGDSRMPDSFTGVSGQFDRNTHWYGARDAVINMMSGNGTQLVETLKNTKMLGSWMYSGTRSPEFSREGGDVPNGQNLSISNPNGGQGNIYYTLDGSDPRSSGGGVSSSAINGNDAVQVRVDGGVTNVKARVYVQDGWWSALHDATYYGPQDLQKVVINEIMYNPLPEGEVDGDNYEFLELYNNGSSDLNLSDATFTDGIEYVFPSNAAPLSPGDYIVLTSDGQRFRERYGFDADGVYLGKLRDSGENIRISEANGQVIDEVTYDDSPPWPTAPDGEGRSLELVEPGASNNGHQNWLVSSKIHGSPGQPNSSGLPVEMSSITAHVNERDVVIQWETSSELNNAGFAIEHAEVIGLNTNESSLFPTAFSAQFIRPKKEFREIGFVEGNGTTTDASSYNFTAPERAVGLHYFRLRQIDFDGRQTYTDELAVSVGTPVKYLLDPAYPNPFNPTTTIRFAVLEESPVSVKMYDMMGRLVQTLFDGVAEQNVMQTLRVDGSELSSGVYFIRMAAPEWVSTKEVVLAK